MSDLKTPRQILRDNNVNVTVLENQNPQLLNRVLCSMNAYAKIYHKRMKLETKIEQLTIPSVINWVAFDFDIINTRPPEYGKYLITRKDGKIHWETWNGSGWAYNHKEIRFWAHITPPDL